MACGLGVDVKTNAKKHVLNRDWTVCSNKLTISDHLMSMRIFTFIWTPKLKGKHLQPRFETANHLPIFAWYSMYPQEMGLSLKNVQTFKTCLPYNKTHSPHVTLVTANSIMESTDKSVRIPISWLIHHVQNHVLPNLLKNSILMIFPRHLRALRH